MVEPMLTARLELRPSDPSDAEELFPIFNDPQGWWYEPAGRHLDIDRTRDWLTRSAARWDSDGLSYWTVREIETGRAVGVGGAQLHRTGAWNINYRIAADLQGRGLATELARAAITAAHHNDDSVPVIAWAASHNTPSRRLAEKVGLVDRGEFVDASDGATRHAYADREVSDFLGRASTTSSVKP